MYYHQKQLHHQNQFRKAQVIMMVLLIHYQNYHQLHHQLINLLKMIIQLNLRKKNLFFIDRNLQKEHQIMVIHLKDQQKMMIYQRLKLNCILEETRYLFLFLSKKIVKFTMIEKSNSLLNIRLILFQ